jgi:membrane protein
MYRFRILQEAFRTWRGNDPLRMGAATAFFSFFALPPIVILLSEVLNILFRKRGKIISNQLFDQLSQLFGSKSASQIANISHNLQDIPQNWLFTVLGFLFLLVGATTLFAIVKSSLNQIWNVKEKTDTTWTHLLKDRGVALGIILFSGILFTLSLLIDTSLALLREHLGIISLYSKGIFIGVIDQIASLVMNATWFAMLFKYLPDIRIRWKAIWVGAGVTTILFKSGAFILEKLLIQGQVGTIFGASGAIVLILLFVFYSSLIFYYGAAFTKAYVQSVHMELEPKSNAVAYEITEIIKVDPS